MSPVSPPAVKPTPVLCRTCGHPNLAAVQECAACGAPVGAGLRKRRAKRAVIAIFTVLVCLILTAGGSAVGWYFWGVTLTVMTDPPNSRVFVDGQEIGSSRDGDGVIQLKHVRAGDHSLRIVRDGYDEWKQSFSTALTDLNKSVSVKLNQTKYKVTISSTPSGSDVLIDDKPVGKTSESSGDLETEALLPGNHSIVVRHDDYRDWKQTITLNADQKVDATLSLAPIVDPATATAESEIRNALDGWAQSSRNRDLDAHMRYYADTLDYYYSTTQTPSSRVREDRAKAFAKFNTMMSVDLTNITVELDTTGQRATVVLDKTFDFKGSNGAFYNGSVQDQLTVTKLGGAWLITGEKESKVYHVNK